jgi:hypothetical protein
MKLELKHLSPYLPYGLRIRGNTHGEIAELTTLSDISVNIKGRSLSYGMWADIFEIKPILRPLSDLTKEIEHNEDSFTPIIELLQINHELVFNYRIENELGKELFEHEINGGCIVWDDVNRRNAFTYSKEGLDHSFLWTYDGDEMTVNQYDLFQKLFEWHFDVFNLIPQDLAIDINTL